MKNYLKESRKLTLTYCHYMYVDTKDYLADLIFAKYQITVKFKKKEFAKDNMRIICCKVRKKDEEKFLKAMEDLKNKAILFGINEYEEICSVLDNLEVK